MQLAKFLWCLYFAPGKEGHVPNSEPTRKIIETVHSAGGVVLISPEGDFDQEQLARFLDMGGDGIMAWHGGQLGVEPRASGKKISRWL